MTSHDQQTDSPDPSTDPDRFTADEAAALDESAFGDATINRRTFLSVAAASGAAFALPGTAVAEAVTDEVMTDEYEFVVNYSRDD